MNKNKILVIINTTQFQAYKASPCFCPCYKLSEIYIIYYHKQKYLYTYIKNKYNTFIRIYTLLFS